MTSIRLRAECDAVYRRQEVGRLRPRRYAPLGRRASIRDHRRGAAQLAKLDRTVAERITEHSRIIAFRNILIHGYANVDDQLVWDIVQTKLPVLRREVEALLKED
jgi:Protein of unknown function DUF86